MRSIGVRELKEQTTQILRAVREKGEEIEVTCRGRTVALLIPAPSAGASTGASSKAWSGLDRLAREIKRRWPKAVSAVDAVRSDRR